MICRWLEGDQRLPETRRFLKSMTIRYAVIQVVTCALFYAAMKLT